MGNHNRTDYGIIPQNKKRALIKLGGRKHLGEMRWKGALELYDKVYCICTYRDRAWEIPDDRIEIIELPKSSLTKNLIGLLVRTKHYRVLAWLNWLLIICIRSLNHEWLNRIKALGSSDILCSYGDYDLSDMTYLLAKPAIKGNVVRSYKETRQEYNYTELKAFREASKIILFSEALKVFIERKYGSRVFRDKQLLIGPDENVLPGCIINNIHYQEKLSTLDGKVHVVILSFRVDSAPNRSRDEGRYYYLDLIRELIDSGLVVHLHCAKYNDDNGVNQYALLAQKRCGEFYLEEPLEMKHSSSAEDWIKSCEILSRYDAGILHNILDNSKVSEFDRINIPHRYFAYQAAHVVPLIKRKENSVLEKRFSEEHTGFIFERYEDIRDVLGMETHFETQTYEDYLQSIFERG